MWPHRQWSCPLWVNLLLTAAFWKDQCWCRTFSPLISLPFLAFYVFFSRAEFFLFHMLFVDVVTSVWVGAYVSSVEAAIQSCDWSLQEKSLPQPLQGCVKFFCPFFPICILNSQLIKNPNTKSWPRLKEVYAESIFRLLGISVASWLAKLMTCEWS